MRIDWGAIPGWFTFQGAYDQLVAALPTDRPSQFVELGLWKGRSSAYLGQEIINSGKPISLTCIDTFQGSLETVQARDPDLEVLEQVFRRNLTPITEALNGRFTLIVGDSAASAAAFTDGSVDVVWVDASHATADVVRDIDAWWPKLAVGGLMGGDDWVWETVRLAVELRFYGVLRLGSGPVVCPWWLVRKGEDGKPCPPAT